jgi:type VI protein secretion system component Hcp
MKSRSALHALVLLAAGTTSAVAATDTYLYIPGVPGEALAAGFEEWIQVETFSVGVVDRACSGFTVMKLLDTSSPILSAAALSGVTYPSMTLKSVKTGDTQQVFLTFSLTSVVVRSVGLKNAAAGIPMEQVTFEPAVIAMSYSPQNPDGSLGQPIQNTLTCSKIK